MLTEIAVLLSKDGQTIEMGQPGKVVVYHKECGAWKRHKEEIYDIGQTSLTQIRKKTKELMMFLEDCKVFVAKSVTGVYYYELEKAGINVWEFAGRPEEFLEYIKAQEEKAVSKENAAPPALPMPTETSEGRYFISIKEIQENNTGITSKQVLLPFLRHSTFYSLEVLCSHVPPWLEAELLSGKLECEVIKINNKEIKVVIMRACCS